MPPKRTQQPTREEILHVTKELARERREKLTIWDVRGALGIHSRLIDQYFGSWAKLRELVGLRKSRAPVEKVISDDELISQYRRICIERGGPPSAAEYERLSGHKWRTLIARFGSREEVHRRARAAQDYINAFGHEYQVNPKPPLPFDEAVLRRGWEQVRIGFALYASDVKEAKGEDGKFPYDLLVVGVNDWLLSPVPVLKVWELLPDGVREV